MRLYQLQVGYRFRLLGKRKVYTKIGWIGRGSNLYVKNSHIQHSKKNPRDLRFIPTCEVRNSSGRKFDMKSWLMIEPVWF